MQGQDGLEERLEKIETKLIYVEDFLTRLQDEVVLRNRDFDRLKAEHEAVKVRLGQLSREAEEIPHQKPPHY
jgi:SlyX protein